MQNARWLARAARFALFATVLAVQGCDPGREVPATPAASPTPTTRGTSALSAPLYAPDLTCTGTGAHDKHATSGIACTTCHPCGGAFALATVTFPGGTTTAGGTITRTATGTTCSVGCHAPFGAPSQPVSWNAGPIGCTTCHSNVQTGSGARSSHFVSLAAAPDCESCHDQSQHTRGQVRLKFGDGTGASGCTGCHGGQGQAIGGNTPPLLVGWSDAMAGDFHGPRPGTCRADKLDVAGVRSIGTGGNACSPAQPAPPGALRVTPKWVIISGASAWRCDLETLDGAGNRVGSVLTNQTCPEGFVQNTACPTTPSQCYPTTIITRGFGGTLAAPYQRGQGALECRACHDAHASSNSFLLAAVVNGVTVAPATIDRAGVGAQALCNACHVGDRHEICKACHKEFLMTDGTNRWFEGAPADPMPDGAACFYCHGHEGLRFMNPVSPVWPPSHSGSTGSKTQPQCAHCHTSWPPPPTEYVAPTFGATLPTIAGVSATTATVTWQTNEEATSYVEYGVGTAGSVQGDAALTRQHTVTITGLTPSTTYVWRVRSSDEFRNVALSSLSSFTTPSATAVPTPVTLPVTLPSAYTTTSATAALTWYPVVAPSNTRVDYEVQLATDTGFTALSNATLPGPGIPGSTVGDSGWIAGTAVTVGGKPALKLDALITNFPRDDCSGTVFPRPYYWRVRGRDQSGNVSAWSQTATFEAIAWNPWCDWY